MDTKEKIMKSIVLVVLLAVLVAVATQPVISMLAPSVPMLGKVGQMLIDPKVDGSITIFNWAHVLSIVVFLASLLIVWRVSKSSQRQHDAASRPQKEVAHRYFTGEECSMCQLGTLQVFHDENDRSTTYATQAGMPYKLKCSHCNSMFDGFYVSGLKM